MHGQVVNELKAVLESFPAARRQEVMTALRKVFAEIGAECDALEARAAGAGAAAGVALNGT